MPPAQTFTHLLMTDWSTVDQHMRTWASRITDDLAIDVADAVHLATTISREVAAVGDTTRDAMRAVSPVAVERRIEELRAFQTWMDIAHARPHPAVVRAQVLTQNYICFVYLKETWFDVLKTHMPAGCVTAKCCDFLLANPVRRFRNGFAHGNWSYLPDFSGLEFWARDKGFGHAERRTVLAQLDLSFWQALSRCTAYASMQTLIEGAA